MTNSANPDQLASERSQLIWIYTVCKDRANPGSAGPGLILFLFERKTKHTINHVTSKDSDKPVHLPSMARILGYPSLDI